MARFHGTLPWHPSTAPFHGHHVFRGRVSPAPTLGIEQRSGENPMDIAARLRLCMLVARWVRTAACNHSVQYSMHWRRMLHAGPSQQFACPSAALLAGRLAGRRLQGVSLGRDAPDPGPGALPGVAGQAICHLTRVGMGLPLLKNSASAAFAPSTPRGAGAKDVVWPRPLVTRRTPVRCWGIRLGAWVVAFRAGHLRRAAPCHDRRRQHERHLPASLWIRSSAERGMKSTACQHSVADNIQPSRVAATVQTEA